MLRRFVWAFLVVSGVVLSGTAWAITATVTGQETGQATKGENLTLVVHSHGVAHTYSGKINPTTGKATVPAVLRKGDTVYASLDGGMTGKQVTEKELNGGVPINFSSGVGPIPSPPTYTGTPTGNMPFQPGYPPGAPIPFAGFSVNGFMSVNFGDQQNTEIFTATDTISTALSDGRGRIGGGLGGAYLVPVTPGLLVGPYANANWSNQRIIRTFSPGVSIGTSDCGPDFTFGAEFGIPWRMPDKDALLYFQIGASDADRTLRNHLVMPAERDRENVWGWTAAAGVALQPRGWQIANQPIGVFAQAGFTEWQDAHYAGQPFSYTVQRGDITLMGGATIYFNSWRW